MTDYDKEEYQQFIRYIKSTWGSLLDGDWVNEPKIKDVVVELFKGTLTVCVSLEPNKYYKYENGELTTEVYDPKEHIKTTYTINEEIILYMMVNGDIIKDLGLNKDKVFINPSYINHIPINKYLSQELEKAEESYAETMYCIAHDL